MRSGLITPQGHRGSQAGAQSESGRGAQTCLSASMFEATQRQTGMSALQPQDVCAPSERSPIFRSVRVLQSKLNQSRRYPGFRNLGKGRRRSNINRGRRTKDRMIEQIECVHAELERMRLGYGESLLQRDVPVLLIRRAESVARGGAPAGRSGIGAAVDGGQSGNERRGAKAFRSQIVIEFLLRGAMGVGVSNSATEKLRGTGCGSEDAAAGAVGDSERQAFLVSDNAADG